MQSHEEIRNIILKELPRIIENDPEVQNLILRLSKQHFAGKERTEDRIERILDELRADRERQDAKWEEEAARWAEQSKKWELHDKRWEEQAKRWEAQDKKWEKQAKRWEEQDKRWGEQAKRWEEQDKKWEENQKVIREMLLDMKALSRKHDTTIGALGARWGLHTEQAFRNALKGILEEFPGVEVLHVTEHDDSGQVFGRPDQVELDLIIKNGMVIIAEIKSSVSKAEMYVFERKVRFYERLQNREVSRIMIISPMVEATALPVAKKLGIEVYNSADDIEL